MAALAIAVGRASALPLSLIAQAIPMLSRHDLEAIVERLIDRLDEQDTETEDLEMDDEPEDENDAELPDWIPGERGVVR